MDNLNNTQSTSSAVLYVGIALVLLFGVWGFCISKGYRGGKILFQPTKGIYAIECVK
jgi:hypothetical protein